MSGQVIAVIPARGGSKGVPRKNLRSLGGRPLVAWTIAAALESGLPARVVLSTEDAEIAEAGRRHGAEVPFLRPAALAGDATPMIDVAIHALDELGATGDDVLLLLQPTSPFRSAADIRIAYDRLQSTGAAAVVGVTEARDHPWLTKRVRDGELTDFVQHPPVSRRQDLEPAYALNGAIYLARVGALRATGTFDPHPTLAHVMPPERSLDIDSPLDLALAEAMARERAGV